MRRDSSQTLHSGIALYVHQSIAMNTRRRTDLEPKGADLLGGDKWFKMTIFADEV